MRGQAADIVPKPRRRGAPSHAAPSQQPGSVLAVPSQSCALAAPSQHPGSALAAPFQRPGSVLAVPSRSCALAAPSQ
eukprot:138157-Chlamydomonas_euryale.AAC.1